MNSVLHSKVFLKNLVTVFLLGVFLLAITPKKTLHYLLAGHKDNTCKTSDGKTQELSKAGFNCQCDDLVVKSNFIGYTNSVVITPSTVHFYFASNFNSFLSLPHLLFNLRGPPVKS